MTIKERVKDLWRLCFDDSEDFIELYFRLRYSNKANITIQNGDEIISALQMIPYQMTFFGSEIKTSYISGACTHPDYRGKGIMKELLSRSFAQMIRKGTPVSTLIPAKSWLFDYYKSMGYAPVFNFSRIRLSPEEIQAPENVQVKEIEEFDKESFMYFDKKMHERSCCIQHDESDFKIILEDLALSGGKAYLAQDNDKITGIIIAELKGSFLLIKELFAENDTIKNALLHQASTYFKPKQIIVIIPPTSDNRSLPLGMARIIYAKSILQIYAAANPEKELNIELRDDQFSLNNGYYFIKNGKCMTTRNRIPENLLQLNISQLTELILAPERPYMNLMID